MLRLLFAPVAQLDRVLPSEGRGRTFESCRARQLYVVKTTHYTLQCDALFCFVIQCFALLVWQNCGRLGLAKSQRMLDTAMLCKYPFGEALGKRKKIFGSTKTVMSDGNPAMTNRAEGARRPGRIQSQACIAGC